MGLFERMPYTNFHDLNLTWILNELKTLEHTINEFVSINALKYADPIQWNIVTQYEKNTIVIDPLTGSAYISVQPVPSGVALTNTDYWTVVFDLGSFVVRAAKNLANVYEAETTLTATVSIPAGSWLIWGDTLYRAKVNITAGDSYVIDSNIEHFTLEDVIGHLEDLNTTDKSNLVAAINELVQALIDEATRVDGITGDPADLNTTDKSNLVAAINEVLSTIGDMSQLHTTDQSTVVAAINETYDLAKSLGGSVNINVITEGADNTGVTDSLTAFLTSFNKAANLGVKVIIPEGTYRLSKPILTDISLLETNAGSYNQYPVVVSSAEYKDFRHQETNRQIGQIAGSGYNLQSCEYVELDNYYVFGYSTSGTDGRIIVTDADFNIIRDSGDIDIGHVNDLAYDPVNRTLATISGNYSSSNNRKIIVISYDSLSIVNTIDLDRYAWQISYDPVNKFYIVLTSENGNYMNIYDDNFTFIRAMEYEYPTSVTGTIVLQGTFIKEGQLYLIYDITTEVIAGYPTDTAFGIIRFNYLTGDVIDYMQWSAATLRDELECACLNNGVITMFGGQFFFYGLTLISDREASVGVQNVSTYRTMLPMGADLDDYFTVGEFVAGWGAIANSIANRPAATMAGFNLDVEMQGIDLIRQTVRENIGNIWYRDYISVGNVWRPWVKIPQMSDIPTLPNYRLEFSELYESANINVSNPYYDYVCTFGTPFNTLPMITIGIKSISTLSNYDDLTARIIASSTTGFTVRITYHGTLTNNLNPAIQYIAIGT